MVSLSNYPISAFECQIMLWNWGDRHYEKILAWIRDHFEVLKSSTSWFDEMRTFRNWGALCDKPSNKTLTSFCNFTYSSYNSLILIHLVRCNCKKYSRISINLNLPFISLHIQSIRWILAIARGDENHP